MLNINVATEGLKLIAMASRFTPRVANRLLKRVRDYSQMNNVPTIDASIVEGALKMLDIDNRGLEKTDRDILFAIAEKFDGGPVGVKSIAAAISEEESTIEDVYEPYLLQIGFLARTPKGRVVTSHGLKHIGLTNTLL